MVTILGLDQNNSVILYHLDNDINKQEQIMKLVPDIRKYFRFDNIKGAYNHDSVKRPLD